MTRLHALRVPAHAARRAILLVAASIPCLPTDALAQQTTARLSVGGGTNTDIRGVTSGAVSVVPSLVAQSSPNTAVTLAGNGTRYQDGGWAATAIAGAVARSSATRAFDLAAELTGARTWTSFGAAVTGGDAALTGGLRLGIAELRAGGRAAGVNRVLPGATLPSLPGMPRRAGADDERTVGAVGPLASLLLRPRLAGGMALELGARAGAWRGDSVRSQEGSLGAQLAGPRLALSASVGQQRTGDVTEGFGQVGASVALLENLSLDLGAGRFASNPVAATTGGRFLSVAVTIATGRRPTTALVAPLRLPSARGVAAPVAGSTRLTITAPRARRVELGGDWNGWQPIATRRADNGVWYADVALPRGRHRIAFRVDGGRWTAPDGAPAEEDDFGGTAAWITVP